MLGGGLLLQFRLPVARLGFTVPFEFHFALDDAVRERAGIFVRDRIVVERADHAERNVRAGDFAVSDFRGGGLAAASRRGQVAGQLVPVQLQREGVRPVRPAVASRHGPDIGSCRIHLFVLCLGWDEDAQHQDGAGQGSYEFISFHVFELWFDWLQWPIDAFQRRTKATGYPLDCAIYRTLAMGCNPTVIMRTEDVE